MLETLTVSTTCSCRGSASSCAVSREGRAIALTFVEYHRFTAVSYSSRSSTPSLRGGGDRRNELVIKAGHIRDKLTHLILRGDGAGLTEWRDTGAGRCHGIAYPTR